MGHVSQVPVMGEIFSQSGGAPSVNKLEKWTKLELLQLGLQYSSSTSCALPEGIHCRA